MFGTRLFGEGVGSEAGSTYQVFDVNSTISTTMYISSRIYQDEILNSVIGNIIPLNSKLLTVSEKI